jgi:hypothetical protein
VAGNNKKKGAYMEDTGSLDESGRAGPSTMARDKQIVCQSENLCTKEDDTSTFFYRYDYFPKPICSYFARYGECPNYQGCVYNHTNEIAKECLMWV